jgi:hypothetical protein
MVKITKLQVLEKHRLHIVFDDGIEKIIDFTPFIGNDPLTKPLSDPDYFKQVEIYENGRGIYWPNDYDVCPDNLRYHIKSIKNPANKCSKKSLQTA